MRVAAKALIFNDQNQLLMLRYHKNHYNEHARGKWDITGGKIKSDEKFADGLAREVFEETGLTELKIEAPVFVSEWWPMARGGGIRIHIVAVFMICRTSGGEVKLNEEHDEFAWVTKDDIGKYDIMPEEVDAIEAAFKFVNQTR